MSLNKEARLFLRSTRNGILSTHSAKFAGYPFGSVTPFVLSHACQPVILISTLAEHTKNIAANPKVSLLVFAGDGDLQANARLTLLGEAYTINKDEDAELRARYLRYLPQTSSYFDMHDFSFYRIEISQLRYIGGFGKMSWVSENALTADLDIGTPLASQEAAIIAHMNADHTDSLISYCKHIHAVEAMDAQMLGIDCDGFDVCAKQHDSSTLLRFNFEQPIHDAASARAALVSLSRCCQTN
ncbi:MAG: pyridoxamine 5'-phosphate oxidase [Betaproteobacteria bacterium HGW-Betaproteobacteria-22]|nr:MAG: pyridoxamine 5'-phosphate oxidase [Betaproteobacteria bacterium HGW-Betaproteobacteria-22]